MNVRKLTFGAQARQALLDGVALAARSAAPTLGPVTRTVLVDRGSHIPDIPGNGYEVTRLLEDEDALRNVGVRFAREAAYRTLQEVGDGATTTLLLTEGLLRAGLRLIAAGIAPQLLKRALESAAQAADEALVRQASPADDPAVLLQVASLACGGDGDLGRCIAEAFQRLGPDAVVAIETVDGHPPELEIREGLWFDRGLASAHFGTASGRADSSRVVLDKVHLVLHDGPLDSVSSILRILEGFAGSGKAIAFVAESFGEQALAALIRNQDNASLKVAAIKAPGHGAQRTALLEDMAVATGGQIIGPALGTSLQHLRPAMLGHAGRLEADLTSTQMIEAGGDPGQIEMRRKILRHDIERQKHLSYDREMLQQRLGRLSAGIAQLRLGGAVESDTRRRKQIAEQGVAATRAAARHGVVPGGGLALFNARDAVQGFAGAGGPEAAGATILAQALELPLRTLLRNAGVDPSSAVAKLVASGGRGHGIDLQSGRQADMHDSAIVEPLDVVRTALRNAVSTAAALLLTEVGVINNQSSKATS
jgi:chaperonin GroEL